MNPLVASSAIAFYIHLVRGLDTQTITKEENDMANNKTVVDYFKKVTLALEAGSDPEHMNLTNGPFQHTFVFGVAADGITLFEKALFARAIGDQQTFDIKGENACEILGYLRTPLMDQLPVPPPFFLKARIVDIDQAENREVVQAMAAAINDCGDSGDCGCGCG